MYNNIFGGNNINIILLLSKHKFNKNGNYKVAVYNMNVWQSLFTLLLAI